MALEVHKPGVSDADPINFLEGMVSYDQIFGRGQAFADHAVPFQTLRREPSRGNAMICAIVDRSAGQERVEKAVYDYMTRVWLFYVLKGAGKFSSKQ